MAPVQSDESALAIQVAGLVGRIDQVIIDQNRRLEALEKREESKPSRTTGIVAVCISGIAVAINYMGGVP